MRRLILAGMTAGLALQPVHRGRRTRRKSGGFDPHGAWGKVLRANTETPLAARAGDILFSGDAVEAIGAPANFLYCPAKSSQTLAAGEKFSLTRSS